MTQAELCKQGKHVATYDKFARGWYCTACESKVR
jgi:hypothetical protein